MEATNLRNTRKELIGKVVSNSMDKSIVVAIERSIMHPMYGKYVLLTMKIMIVTPGIQFNLWKPSH